MYIWIIPPNYIGFSRENIRYYSSIVCFGNMVYYYYLSEGFTGTKGAVKPRSSLDVTDLRSVKSTDDEKKEEVEPTCCQRWFPQITLFFKK